MACLSTFAAVQVSAVVKSAVCMLLSTMQSNDMAGAVSLIQQEG